MGSPPRGSGASGAATVRFSPPALWPIGSGAGSQQISFWRTVHFGSGIFSTFRRSAVPVDIPGTVTRMSIRRFPNLHRRQTLCSPRLRFRKMSGHATVRSGPLPHRHGYRSPMRPSRKPSAMAERRRSNAVHKRGTGDPPVGHGAYPSHHEPDVLLSQQQRLPWSHQRPVGTEEQAHRISGL